MKHKTILIAALVFSLLLVLAVIVFFFPLNDSSFGIEIQKNIGTITQTIAVE